MLLTLGLVPHVVPVACAGPPAAGAREDVGRDVESILQAELAYDAAFGRFVPAGSRAEALASLTGKQPHAWAGDAAWKTLGWHPDGPVRSAYWVEVDGHDFTVHGVCDLDGDGVPAEYVGTKLVMPPDVY
jgi:hypothetical protein